MCLYPTYATVCKAAVVLTSEYGYLLRTRSSSTVKDGIWWERYQVGSQVGVALSCRAFFLWDPGSNLNECTTWMGFSVPIDCVGFPGIIPLNFPPTPKCLHCLLSFSLGCYTSVETKYPDPAPVISAGYTVWGLGGDHGQKPSPTRDGVGTGERVVWLIIIFGSLLGL